MFVSEVFVANPFPIVQNQKLILTRTKIKSVSKKNRSIFDYYLAKNFFKKGEAKSRKDLSLPSRKKNFFVLPEFNKEEVKEKVRNTLYKYPIIPYLFYGFAIL